MADTSNHYEGTPMTKAKDLRTVGERIDGLLEEFAAVADPRMRDRAEELVRLLMELYGGALDRVLHIVDEAGRPDEIMTRLSADDLVSSLLVLHNLHPLDVETRILRALDRVRPYLGSAEFAGAGGARPHARFDETSELGKRLAILHAGAHGIGCSRRHRWNGDANFTLLREQRQRRHMQIAPVRALSGAPHVVTASAGRTGQEIFVQGNFAQRHAAGWARILIRIESLAYPANQDVHPAQCSGGEIAVSELRQLAERMPFSRRNTAFCRRR